MTTKAETRKFITQATEEFLAKGGKIKKCPTKSAVKRYPRGVDGYQPEVTVTVEAVVDNSKLPAELRAKFGLK